jgi:cysteine-rich repeat protein
VRPYALMFGLEPPAAVGRRTRALLFPVAVAALVACNTSSGPAPVGTTTSVCGNAMREAGEACDDGNASNADGCLTTCQIPVTWVASDVHVHTTGCGHPMSPGELADLLKVQGIQVGATLVWGWDYDAAAVFFTGRDHPLSTPGFILHYDLEVSRFAAAKTGHLLLLGLDSLAFSPDVFNVPQSGVPVVDWARRQPRAVVGMAHGQYWPSDGSFPLPPGGCCVPWEVVVHAARGRLDFLSMERPLDEEPGTFLLWKALQNSGFRVAIAGGSDFSCLTDQFEETSLHADVIVDGELTYESWLRALKAGRSTASTSGGNRLNLRVEGHRLGEEVQLSAPQDVAVSVETAGKTADVEILVNGEVAAHVPVAGGFQVVTARVRVSKSSWISARSPFVLTSPVYVLVEGKPIRASPEDTCYLLRSVEHLQDLVTSRRLRLFDSTDEALRAYAEAAGELERRFTDSGGVSCR